MSPSWVRCGVISAGVFIGNPSARIRDVLWDEVQQFADLGQTLLAHTTNNEKDFTFRTHDRNWHPVDHEGLTLIHRPNAAAAPWSESPKPGWSKASKRHRFDMA
ncbi:MULTISPECIES: type I-E CRISPR-associated endoribonuclease Cas2 [unclassified Streptomyces]|uniref:type I-E CRISPR-associated endoribonuclease Cas2 n=1 Tax=unclassified Streptomyces TaxID=2593676 RepID=UPI00382D8DEB